MQIVQVEATSTMALESKISLAAVIQEYRAAHQVAVEG